MNGLRGFLCYEPQIVIMKKLSILIAGFAILLLTASSFADKRREASLGSQIPELVLSQNDSVMTLEALKGKWVVLSFWSASDAVSRVTRNEVNRFSNYMREHSKAENIEIVSVNFDRSESLMNEISRLDNLDDSSLQFHVSDSGQESEIRDAFCMNAGLRTFIINPEGVLVEADPTFERLCDVIG